MQASNRRNDQTAHISLQISINVKERGNNLLAPITQPFLRAISEFLLRRFRQFSPSRFCIPTLPLR